MFGKLLVPLDGSKVAEIALPYAEEIAAKFGAEIILASVSESPSADTRHLYHSYLERTAEQVKRQLSYQRAREEATVGVKTLMGKPADEILRYADENSVSLIVIASRGAGESPLVLGNITWKVLQATDKPVLLIRAPASSAALEEKRLVKKILVPLDGSEIGGLVIPHVEALAQGLGAEVVLLHVLEVPASGVLVVPGATLAYMAPTPEAEERRVASVLNYLDGVEKALKDRDLSVSSVVNSGFVADSIIEYAEKNAIDLIAMSTHGRSGIGRWVFGSVTRKVLHIGSTAVLTVRATKG